MSPIYLIPPDEMIFPHPSEASPDGIVGIGGDLSPERLLLAYRFGIFPWFGEGDPIIWWSPDPRLVLFPEKLKIAKSMRPYLKQDRFTWSVNQCFEEVIHRCSTANRKGQEGTWILPEMEAAYIQLHRLGYAHSVEVWEAGQLVGGLYGLQIGKIYYGESMFTLVPNASKFGFIKWVQYLQEKGIVLIDCQQDTEHLRNFGAELISRDEFLGYLRRNWVTNSPL